MAAAAIPTQGVAQPLIQGTVTFPAGPFANASLYVGDLDQGVNEAQLYEFFSSIGQVLSVRVCRDQTRRSLGYGYVNYGTAQDAATAIDILNFTPINGKPIRIMHSHRDPSIRKSGIANVFIKNLDPSLDNKSLHDIFAAFGSVLSCKVALDINGQSKGYGFVQFEKEEYARNAINKLNGMLFNDRQVYVGSFVRRQDRNQTNDSPKFTNVYVKNFSETVTDEELKELFSPFGNITSAVVMKDANGNSRCFGFVNFQSPDSADAAVRSLNGTTSNDDKVLYVGRAKRKTEREAELRTQFEQERISRYEKLQGANLYLKNLDDTINDEKLKEMFSEFGTVTSCKIMCDPSGRSKGSGFVAFSTPEEANNALAEMNGKLFDGKPLYVAIAQRKEERKAHLQEHFAQLHGHGIAPMPGIHGPRLAPQQLYFGQGTGILPPQPAGFGFQQQLIPRPGVGPNFVMPYQLQRQQGQQPGQRMGGYRRNNNLSHAPYQQQQMLHRNSNHQGHRYIGNHYRNNMEPPVIPQGYVGPVMPLPFDRGSRIAPPPPAPNDIIQRRGSMSAPPLDNQSLASALSSASPQEQQRILGEYLYPLVNRLEPNHAGKVTGMLLEMDQSEVIHLIESPEDLKSKVSEAMQALLRAAEGSEVTEHLSSLGLSEERNC